MHFDKTYLMVLWRIKRSGDNGITWWKLIKKSNNKIGIFFLESLCKEGYTVAKDLNGNLINFETPRNWLSPQYKSFTTPKGNALIEKTFLGLIKWVVPTIISVIALAISVIALLYSVYGEEIFKVMLINNG